MPRVKLPEGWEQFIYPDEIMWWNESWRPELGDENMLFVSAYPCVGGFFVTRGAYEPDDSDVSTVPIAGPFRNLLAAIAAANLIRL